MNIDKKNQPARKREAEGTAAPLISPKPHNLDDLKQAAAACRACPLWLRGSQTVFGEGLESARVILVGEQPGDEEDREGRPFVGPAGRILDKALESAGIDRKDAMSQRGKALQLGPQRAYAVASEA